MKQVPEIFPEETNIQSSRVGFLASRVWIIFALIGFVQCLAFVLPVPSAVFNMNSPLVNFFSTLAIVLGMVLHKSALRRVWIPLAISQVLYLAVAIINTYFHATDPQNMALFEKYMQDGYLVCYLLQVIGYGLVVRLRTRGRDFVNLLDAAVIATSGGLLMWVYFMSPVVHNSQLSFSAKLVALEWPTFGIFLLAIIVRLIFAPGARKASFWFFCASAAAQLAGEISYAITQLHGSYTPSDLTFLFWGSFPILIGLAACHPSTTTLTARPNASEKAPNIGWRLPLLAAAALMPPAVLILSPEKGEVTLVALVSAVIFLAVLVRIAGLSREVERFSAELDLRLQDLEESLSRERAVIATRDALEVELRHSQKLEAVGRLAAGVAHEINTPLQVMTDNVRFLQQAIDTLGISLGSVHPELGKAVDTHLHSMPVNNPVTPDELLFIIEESPTAALDTLNGLKQISKIVQAMKLFGDPDAVAEKFTDLNEALRALVTITDSEIRDVADLEMDLGDIPNIKCRSSDINQVFLHLLNNAVYAIKDTGRRGTVTIRSERRDNYINISLIDTGVGIPDSVKDKIFDPFFTTKAVGAGMGQGLAVVRSIVLLHGGSINVESQEGIGTTVTLSLPLENSVAAYAS